MYFDNYTENFDSEEERDEDLSQLVNGRNNKAIENIEDLLEQEYNYSRNNIDKHDSYIEQEAIEYVQEIADKFGMDY